MNGRTRLPLDLSDSTVSGRRLATDYWLLLLIASIFLLDRVTKDVVAATNYQLPTTNYKLTSFITVTQHQNFGLLADLPVPRWIILVFTSLILLILARFVLVYLTTNKSRDAYPLALILGGALGNLWDRIAYGYVFDWILLFNRSVINLADVAISVGVVWYALNKWKKRAHPAVE